jgi:hypothetical protein
MIAHLQSNDPLEVAYAVLHILAALALVAMLVVPSWRPKLFETYLGLLLWVVGTFGWLYIIGIGVIVDVSAWSTTAAGVIMIIIGVGIVTGLLFAIAKWLKRRLREPRPLHRIVRDITFCVALAGVIFILDFVEKRFHVPAFLITTAVIIPVIFAVVWWKEKQRKKIAAAERT